MNVRARSKWSISKGTDKFTKYFGIFCHKQIIVHTDNRLILNLAGKANKGRAELKEEAEAVELTVSGKLDDHHKAPSVFS